MQKFKVFSQVHTIQAEILTHKSKGQTIGFVPTMGALHLGHISLVEEAKKFCDVVVVSVFVNPTQFNNPEDLKKYPRTIDADLALLSESGAQIIFTPTVDEIYPKNSSNEKLDLGTMDRVMEGKFRPGHFDGVLQVVKRLFDIVQPNVACFGKKDFQQLAVIKYMTESYALPIKIIGCEIVRESSGLAMSSRNMRLSEKQKEDALIIIETLQFVKLNERKLSPKELKKQAVLFFQKSNLLLEYLEIVDPSNLKCLSTKWVDGATCCIACYCGEVRLIDNIQLL
jgi:pantoate--beta-alanine ligase